MSKDGLGYLWRRQTICHRDVKEQYNLKWPAELDI